MKKLALAFAASTMAVTGIGTAAPALADPPSWAPAHGKRAKDRAAYSRYDNSRYDRRGYYVQPQRITRSDRMWRGDDGRYYCKKENGTTGLLIGAGVGGLIGHEVVGRNGDRTLGAILGAAGGALLGRAIDRSSTKCR